MSDHWKNLRATKLALNFQCQVCGTENNLDVHHVRYKSLYDVGMRDLLTLCRTCHETLHEWMKTTKFQTWDDDTKKWGLPPFMRKRIETKNLDFQI